MKIRCGTGVSPVIPLRKTRARRPCHERRMRMPIIENLSALEILDSRGRPTISCTVRLAGGVSATASTPSGASTGRAEALELRDGDQARYRGLGCRKAVANIAGEIAQAL